MNFVNSPRPLPVRRLPCQGPLCSRRPLLHSPPMRRFQERVLPHARYAMQDETGQWKVVAYDKYVAAFGARRLLRRGGGAAPRLRRRRRRR